MKYALLFLLLTGWTTLPTGGIDDLPINEIQVIGAHNSYKQAIAPALFHVIKDADSGLARHID